MKNKVLKKVLVLMMCGALAVPAATVLLAEEAALAPDEPVMAVRVPQVPWATRVPAPAAMAAPLKSSVAGSRSPAMWQLVRDVLCGLLLLFIIGTIIVDIIVVSLVTSPTAATAAITTSTPARSRRRTTAA